MRPEALYVFALKRLPLKSQSSAERRCNDINAILTDHPNQRHTYKSDTMSDSKMQFDNYSDNNMSDITLLDTCVADDHSADISYQSTSRLLSISPISCFDVSHVLPNANRRLFRQTAFISCTQRCAHDDLESIALSALQCAFECRSPFRRIS